ncbi:acylneuraminate cytidylyltransferase family protein [Thalassospira sp. HF15]|uniref:acylneuraminate cytidylyltransferase family protein n=1 Tax=Thalassospira sp. HF15 TaxID=2722755 RepID=UPI00142FE3B6|nr:acylneuraminate cytidylyltransferase family protein [Thalassospira sp. HF15]NIY75428.1 acylneuraminate cytidylyltransferase family protein [Thalassospira sp. HF15]
MLADKSILAVVPARGGSKGIKLKNLREVGGLSLVARTGKIIQQLPEIDAAVVSTDHELIAEEALRHGISAPFIRPPELSGDRIGDVEVLSHALLEAENAFSQTFDIVLMLQPTSPLRKADHVRQCLQKFCESDVDATWTVSETDSKAHPLKQLKLNVSGGLELYDKEGSQIIARQQLEPLYHRNGVAYAISRECLINKKSISGDKFNATVIDEYLANIDTEIDLKWADFLLSESQ